MDPEVELLRMLDYLRQFLESRIPTDAMDAVAAYRNYCDGVVAVRVAQGTLLYSAGGLLRVTPPARRLP